MSKSLIAVNRIALVVLLTLLGGLQALYASPLFGPEFNFTNDAIKFAGRKLGPLKKSSEANIRARDRMKKIIESQCPQCRIESPLDKSGNVMHRIFHPDGWDFSLTLDANAVEVIVTPMTPEQIETHQEEMQRLIFDVTAKADLHPKKTAGQIHIGMESAFEGSALLFRNFIADWTYYSAATYKLFGANANAPTIDQLGEESLLQMQHVIQEFDRKLEAPKGLRGVLKQAGQALHLRNTEKEKAQGRELILEFAHRIISFVYTKTIEAWLPVSKFQNMNLDHIWGDPSSDTIELRGVPEFKTIADYLAFAKLLKGRLEYLKQFEMPIPYLGVQKVDTPVDAVKMMSRFVQESNVDGEFLRTYYGSEYRSIQASVPSCRSLHAN